MLLVDTLAVDDLYESEIDITGFLFILFKEISLEKIKKYESRG